MRVKVKWSYVSRQIYANCLFLDPQRLSSTKRNDMQKKNLKYISGRYKVFPFVEQIIKLKTF